MSKISFEGIGQQVATFEAAAGVTAGHVVKMADNGKVSKCSEGEDFCGVALNVRGGCAGVQLRGCATLSGGPHCKRRPDALPVPAGKAKPPLSE